MNGGGFVRAGETVEPAKVAAYFAATAGLLSLLVPFFEGLTVALSALLLTARLYQPRRAMGCRPPPASRLAIGFGAIGATWALVLLPVDGLPPWRGALLGLGSLAFFWGARPIPDRTRGRD